LLGGLKYLRAWRRPKTAAGNSAAAPSYPADLHAGSNRCAGNSHARSDSHSRALLASHFLELALTLAPEPLLVVVLGPTSSGKTVLALALAECCHGEIVNCDSVAMYREFEIGTAKPTAEERRRAPHHLLDFVEPTSFITAGEYARLARKAIQEINSRGRLPIVVGGTGLYLKALLEGLFPGPQRCEQLRERLREKARHKGSAHLQKILRHLDRHASEKIHANDTPKLIRAIEVCLASRQKMTEIWKQGREGLKGFRILRIGLNPNRDQLYDRINRRAEKMFASGLIEETRRLLHTHQDAARPLAALGYKQALQFLRGEIDEKGAVQTAQQAHRNYAKRQMTWFRREPEITWLAGFGDDPAVQKSAIALVKNSLLT
jgi:tRNA dimethylallyltransferase